MSDKQKQKKPKTFDKPVVGHREYVTRGPSGFPETYLRSEADAMLIELLGDFPLTLALEQFLASDPVKREGLQWIHVTDYLARMTKSPFPEKIPIPAAIAFWAKAITAKRASEGLA